jgi:hypothetical protein
VLRDDSDSFASLVFRSLVIGDLWNVSDRRQIIGKRVRRTQNDFTFEVKSA